MRNNHDATLETLKDLGGRACATQIARRMGKDPSGSNMNKVLIAMERKGMVKQTGYALYEKRLVKVWEVVE